jgi:hypothetical protein
LRVYIDIVHTYIYICIYVYNYIVFSSAKPVTLVDVLGNILDDNEYGTNDHRVITSDKICGSGRPDSWGLLYAQWTRDCWCGRHRKDVVLLRRAEPFSGVLGSGGPFLSG